MQRLLRGFHPDYDEGIDFTAFAASVERASSRARRLDDDAMSMGEPGRNPTTGLYLLTDSISRRDD